MRVNLIFFLVLFLLVPLTSHAAAIHDAAKTGDIAAITAALDAGADVNGRDVFATPLYYAVDAGHLEAAKLLISRGANVETPSIWGPPLLPAAFDGRIELVTLLLDSGANPNVQYQTKTALHTAAERGWLDCVKALVEAGADVNACLSIRHQSPIHLAKLNKHGDMADYLMAHGVVLPKPAPISAKLAAADVEKGHIAFTRHCTECHFIEPEKGRKTAPNLWGVVGRGEAALPDQGYSDALQVWGGDWNYEDMNTWLYRPLATTPGAFMEIPGIEDDTERANLIAYLRTQSDKPLPLPGN
jgi:cytochrome c